ncbi:MAG TPA: hypothetical protein VGC41_02990 [Kofleriaceae bacterium]
MNDGNQGEGDKISAGKYNRDVREFIKEGKVHDAAKKARDFVDTQPDLAARAERQAKAGPKSWIERTIENVKAVLHRK